MMVSMASTAKLMLMNVLKRSVHVEILNMWNVRMESMDTLVNIIVIVKTALILSSAKTKLA